MTRKEEEKEIQGWRDFVMEEERMKKGNKKGSKERNELNKIT